MRREEVGLVVRNSLLGSVTSRLKLVGNSISMEGRSGYKEEYKGGNQRTFCGKLKKINPLGFIWGITVTASQWLSSIWTDQQDPYSQKDRTNKAQYIKFCLEHKNEGFRTISCERGIPRRGSNYYEERVHWGKSQIQNRANGFVPSTMNKYQHMWKRSC